jgi:outer membrane protein assembly factor BamB
MQSHRLFVSVLVMALIMGATPAAAAGTPGTEKWAFSTIDEVPIEQVRSSPAVGADGTVYFGVNNNLYAFNPGGGEPKWVFINGGLLHSSPAIGADGTVYVGGEDGNLYAVNPEDGSPKWASPFATGVEGTATGKIKTSTPAIGADGTVYVGVNYPTDPEDDSTGTGKLFAVTDNGSNAAQKWVFPPPFPITAGVIGYISWSSPAIGRDGTVYIGAGDNILYAVKPDGSQKWIFDALSPIDCTPAIGADGTIYVGTDAGKLYALKPDGSPKWASPFATGGYVASSPAIGVDGTIYFGSADGKLYAVTDNVTNASKKWEFITGGIINHSSPAIGADGTIYIGTRIGGGAIPENGNLLALTDNGASANPTLKWAAFVTGGYVDSSPAIGADGTVYVGSKKIIGVGVPEVPEITGVFYAVYSESLGLAKSAWPMFHQNLRHTSLGKLGTDIAPINFLLLGD